MADSNETTAYGFKILFRIFRRKKNEEAAASELNAETPNTESNATLDFECYKTHSTEEHSDKKIITRKRIKKNGNNSE